MSKIYPWQQNDWSRLQSLRQHLPHGLLIKGAKGIGKLDLALHYAHSLLCQSPVEQGIACGKCASCHWLAQHLHPDFRLIQAAANVEGADLPDETKTSKGSASKQISVTQIRELADFVTLSSHQGGLRIVLIQQAEVMNQNAANALLKSLEEPPPGLLFILVSDKPQQLLPTILSRCLAFQTSSPEPQVALAWLQQQGVENAAQAYAHAGFSPLLAASQMALPEERELLLRGLRQPRNIDVLALTDALQKIEQPILVNWLQQWCYDLISMKLAGRVRYHLNEQNTIRKIVESVDALTLARLQKHLFSMKRESQHTLNAKLFLESLLFSYRQALVQAKR